MITKKIKVNQGFSVFSTAAIGFRVQYSFGRLATQKFSCTKNIQTYRVTQYNATKSVAVKLAAAEYSDMQSVLGGADGAASGALPVTFENIIYIYLERSNGFKGSESIISIGSSSTLVGASNIRMNGSARKSLIFTAGGAAIGDSLWPWTLATVDRLLWLQTPTRYLAIWALPVVKY
jgi:hypothetical protein